MWLGENHKEALATLRYGILDNKGFLLLTGDVGTGKTTLINTLIGSLSKDVIYASVPDPSLEKMDFFNYIASAFGLGSEFESKGKFLSTFTGFLRQAYGNGRKVLLIIDEAQLLTQELLEEVRLLSNIVTRDSNPILNIFFVGQYEFNELIRHPENRAIAQRITLNYYIEPLSLEETGDYIRHRLKIAGTTKKIFNTSAIKEIYAFSNGFPRKINIICDHCLMSGYADEKKTITSAIVRDSAGDLRIPEYKRAQSDDEQTTKPISDNASEAVGNPKLHDKTMKMRFSWPVSIFLFIIVLMMAVSSLFLYYSNIRYKEATAHFTAIQEKFGESQPSGQITSQDKGREAVPLSAAGASSATITDSGKNLEPAASGIAAQSEKTESLQYITELGEKNVTVGGAGSTKEAPTAEMGETVNPMTPKSDGIEPVKRNEGTTKKPSGQNSATLILPLPVDPLVIRFKYDSNLFSVIDIEKMKNFAAIVKAHPGAIVNIFGYTDSTGDQGYNKKLSEFRANMVKSFLMGQNLSPEQLKAEGLGNVNPVDDNDTEQGRMRNRRVEISVIAKK